MVERGPRNQIQQRLTTVLAGDGLRKDHHRSLGKVTEREVQRVRRAVEAKSATTPNRKGRFA